jgi:GNAT superfamily N-acetyltransferase
MTEALDTTPAGVARGLRQALRITPVRGVRDLRAFVELPYRLHAGTPWVPPLKLERYMFLSKKLNPYFTHGEAEYFLARRDGRVLGRITAQIDRAFNEFHQNRWGNFGFLEFEEDQEVLDGLLAAAESWLRERGCERMVGPMDFQLNDESGVLYEGFEHTPLIRQPWHPPYYQQMCETAALTKAKDLYSYWLDVADRGKVLPILPEVAERARSKYGVTIRKMSRRRLRRDMDEFAKVYNAAWSTNWGFVPYSKHDLDELARTYQLVYSRDWFMVAELKGETVAMAISIPDINQVLKKMKGRLLPFGWWHYLNKGRIMNGVRVGFLGVMPEHQHTGAAALLYMEHYDMAEKTPQKWGEPGWILEDNHSMNRGLEAMGATVVKRYRVYERLLEDASEPAVEPADPATGPA